MKNPLHRHDEVSVATRLARLLGAVLGPDLPVTIRAWDGSHARMSADTADPVIITVHSRRAVRYVLASPNQIGLARAYVTGQLTVDGDLDRALAILFHALGPVKSSSRASAMARLWQGAHGSLSDVPPLWGLGPVPRPPTVEARLHGPRHSRSRDHAAIRHHYDLDNDFYRLLLGPSMTYSCAYWTDPGEDLTQAQAAKHRLIAAKLGLQPGKRVLDIGCGWGSFLIHAATQYGARGVGVTLSGQQARMARDRVRTAGVEGLVTIEHRDYRDLTGESFDAIASVGMAEHVGTGELDTYAHRVTGFLAPGGRLLHHSIATRAVNHRQDTRPADTFITRYVFPDGQLQPLHVSITALERAGLEIRDVQALREHYPRTLWAWTANLRDRWASAVTFVGPERARIWELYLSASAIAFDRDQIGVNQILAVRPSASGKSHMPAGRPESIARPRPDRKRE